MRNNCADITFSVICSQIFNVFSGAQCEGAYQINNWTLSHRKSNITELTAAVMRVFSSSKVFGRGGTYEEFLMHPYSKTKLHSVRSEVGQLGKTSFH